MKVYGNLLEGVVVNENEFQGITTLDQIENYGLDRPSQLAGLAKKNERINPDLAKAKRVRELVQRRFDAERQKRAESYSRYIERQSQTRMGGTPAITLWCPTQLETVESGLVIPYNEIIVAIDGETQTEARFKLRDKKPETGKLQFKISLYHGISADAAEQILHDYNAYVTPVRETLVASRNHTGPLSKVISESVLAADLPDDEFQQNQELPKSSKNIRQTCSYLQLMYAAAGYVLGEKASKTPASLWFGELNSPDCSYVIDDSCKRFLVKMIGIARVSDALKRSRPVVWQSIGVKAKSGTIPTVDGVEAGVLAYNSCGDRSGTAARINAVLKAA